jgi:hypothetical protein
MRIRRRRKSASLDEAEAAIARASRGAEQAAEARKAAEASRDAERRFFARLLADPDAPDKIAGAIKASLKGGRP